MTTFKNIKKERFLAGLAERPSLHDADNDLTIRSKFNFSYFDDSQASGQKFSDWEYKHLCELLDKLKHFTTKPLDYWKQERVGRGGLKVLAVYGRFPTASKFEEPKHIPHQAEWCRFRLGSSLRLVGFIIPADLHKTFHKTTGECFDKNTFYVVFLDRYHKFYCIEKK